MNKQDIERLAIVETKVEIIDSKVDSLHSKIDCFIESANDKYASKTRVSNLEKQVNNHAVKLAYYAGGLAVVLVVIELVFKFGL